MCNKVSPDAQHLELEGRPCEFIPGTSCQISCSRRTVQGSRSVGFSRFLTLSTRPLCHIHTALSHTVITRVETTGHSFHRKRPNRRQTGVLSTGHANKRTSVRGGSREGRQEMLVLWGRIPRGKAGTLFCLHGEIRQLKTPSEFSTRAPRNFCLDEMLCASIDPHQMWEGSCIAENSICTSFSFQVPVPRVSQIDSFCNFSLMLCKLH